MFFSYWHYAVLPVQTRRLSPCSVWVRSLHLFLKSCVTDSYSWALSLSLSLSLCLSLSHTHSTYDCTSSHLSTQQRNTSIWPISLDITVVFFFSSFWNSLKSVLSIFESYIWLKFREPLYRPHYARVRVIRLNFSEKITYCFITIWKIWGVACEPVQVVNLNPRVWHIPPHHISNARFKSCLSKLPVLCSLCVCHACWHTDYLKTMLTTAAAVVGGNYRYHSPLPAELSLVFLCGEGWGQSLDGKHQRCTYSTFT